MNTILHQFLRFPLWAFFYSRISFFTSYYNFEVNRHEKVGQKRETANFEDIRLRGGQYNILGLRGVSQKVMRVKGGVISKANKRIQAVPSWPFLAPVNRPAMFDVLGWA